MIRILATVILLLISSCSNKKPLTVVCDDRPSVKLELSDPKPLNFNDVNFRVVTRDNVHTILNELEDRGQVPVLYSLTEDGYKSLSINMNELRRYIIESNKVLFLYREYYENTNR